MGCDKWQTVVAALNSSASVGSLFPETMLRPKKGGNQRLR